MQQETHTATIVLLRIPYPHHYRYMGGEKGEVSTSHLQGAQAGVIVHLSTTAAVDHTAMSVYKEWSAKAGVHTPQVHEVSITALRGVMMRC